MCGRYFIDNGIENPEMKYVIETLTKKIGSDKMAKVKVNGEIFPSDVVPVLAGGKIVPMSWGFRQHSGTPIINARSETAGLRHMFKQSFREMRCLIPATGYYEWMQMEDGQKQKLAFTPASGIIYMAGIYRMERFSNIPSFTILTRRASQYTSHIHDRMPVIFIGDSRRAWLNGDDPRNTLHEAVRFVRYKMI